MSTRGSTSPGTPPGASLSGWSGGCAVSSGSSRTPRTRRRRAECARPARTPRTAASSARSGCPPRTCPSCTRPSSRCAPRSTVPARPGAFPRRRALAKPPMLPRRPPWQPDPGSESRRAPGRRPQVPLPTGGAHRPGQRLGAYRRRCVPSAVLGDPYQDQGDAARPRRPLVVAPLDRRRLLAPRRRTTAAAAQPRATRAPRDGRWRAMPLPGLQPSTSPARPPHPPLVRGRGHRPAQSGAALQPAPHARTRQGPSTGARSGPPTKRHDG